CARLGGYDRYWYFDVW
nr:immunoglobulin heavy chain junction region [Mus musculus]MBK4187126.1 immunoglobulin heavy chain junction region [Mus musculus]MBK4187127.1 immunoglobulin heavy chain junction region [Mus musculus]